MKTNIFKDQTPDLGAWPLLAVLYAYYRRYIEKLQRLKRGFKFEHICLGQFDFTSYAPVSSALAVLSSGMSQRMGGALFYFLWWVHLLDVLVFMVYVPQSKHAHLLAKGREST